MPSTKRQRRTTKMLAGGAAALLVVGGVAAWAGEQGGPHFGPGQAPPKLVKQVKQVKRVKKVKKAKITKAPRIDLVFALDTTGSMAGLLDGAKRKIWAIANRVVSGQPRPDVRIGLVAYRDHGDEYVTKRFPLTKDIDSVQENLLTLQANGGGDTPEHVNKALAEAIREMDWGQGPDVLKLLFLVGDAPPQEGRDGLTSAGMAKEARDKGIIVNSIQCGADVATAAVWKSIAFASGGKFATIAQDGGVVATVSSPFDKRLAELNVRLADDALAFGGKAKKARTRAKIAKRKALAPAVAAAAASYGAKSGRMDSGDLLTALMEGTIASFEDMDEADMPEAAQAVAKPKRTAWLRGRKANRKKLESEILKASADRDEWLAVEEAKGGGPKADAFDTNVLDMLRDQASSIGVLY